MRVFESLAEFTAQAGRTLGTSDWLEIGQERVGTFADATGDHQWIHVDPVRAAEGPFGTTIAHGYLSLSLLPVLVGTIYRIEGLRMSVNYGLNKVRFPSPVPVGSRVRVTTELREAKESNGGVMAVLGSTMEIEGGTKPACVAETISLYYPKG
ncbi:MaoC family dehydratase [Nonomuraea sp. NPDC049486]|jgi:acyl dehydratase|uniref:MaoC family dehydratase n=1 Tax=Nonomuraea sp. NPDC049486 TaxID=3155773 RepID=UPI00341EEDFD